jgi:hypothetical protein
MLKKISTNYLYLGKFFLIFLILVIIFFSIPFSAKIPYFWQDFTFAKQAHNENLLKGFLEVLPNSKNINGITIWILEPSLNFLSKLNYNFSSKYEFYKYFSVLRTLEILTLLLFLLSFKEKFELKNILTILFLYLILLVNFNRYDHESYINFPIIIFCLFHAASIRIKNNLIFFLLIFLGNLWSFLINPIYFFVICFGPLIFFYTYHLYHKQFKKFFLTLIANIPFTILFIMLSLGTSRFALSELYLGYDSIHRNVALFTRKNFIVRENVKIYPDTLVWMRDFSYAYNEPMTKRYFAHPSFGNYPVVGINWKQAKAFTHWRTMVQNKSLANRGMAVESNYRLPSEAEWEYAARGTRTNSMYPWGNYYPRNKKGCLLANFKPGRGNYAEDGGFYTVRADAYWPNDYGLYNMSGNVAEWTSSYYNEGSYNFFSEMSPDLRYDAKDSDPPYMKRKTTRGGSWKDVAFYLQTSTRAFEYQDTAKSYIGFRCVIDLAPRMK